MTDLEKIHSLLRHIHNVQQNCTLLGERLIEAGEFENGRILIARGLVHDASKFFGIEWDQLDPENGDVAKLKLAVDHHNRTNPHHPEHWGSIHNVPETYLAEMTCDWKARSTEFGSSLRDWIINEATRRWGFTKEDRVFARIMRYVDMLCEKPFRPLQTA